MSETVKKFGTNAKNRQTKDYQVEEEQPQNDTEPKEKRLNLKLIFSLIISLFMIAGVAFFATRIGDNEVYDKVMKAGYISGRNVEQTLFFMPQGLKPDLHLESFENLDIQEGKSYELTNDHQYAVFNPKKTMLYVTNIKNVKANNVNQLFNAFEKDSRIRVTSSEMAGSSIDEKSSKYIFNVSAQIMFSKEVFKDFYGKLAVVKKDNDVCYYFIGNAEGKTNVSEPDMLYMAKSLQYINYKTALNSSEISISDNKDLKISDSKTVKVGEYGYTSVVNKTDNPDKVDIIARVDTVVRHADENIKNGFQSTSYKGIELPEASKGNEWCLATITYNFNGNDVSEVLPHLAVKLSNGKENVRTYTLSRTTDIDPAGNYTLKVYYEIPEGQEHTLLIGSIGDPLQVTIDKEVPVKEDSKEVAKDEVKKGD